VAHFAAPLVLRQRLSARIVALSLGLLLVVQLLGFETIRRTIDRTARAQLAQELERGAVVWTEMLAHQAAQIELAGRMAAKDYGFQQTLFGEGADDDTVASALESLAGRVDAELSAFVGIDGAVRGVLAGEAGADAVHRLATQMASGKGRRGVHVLAGRPYHLVATEILAPVRRGWLLFGYPIDRELIARLRTLAGMEVALVAGQGAQRRVVLASLDLGAEASAQAATGADELEVAGETMLVRRVALGQTEVVLMRSIPRAVAPYKSLQGWLGLITAVGLVVFSIASLGVARYVTTPLSALVQASRRLGLGRYDEAVAGLAREDEIGTLAQALDHMRVGIAEREAKVHQLAYFDKLTGLPNRAHFSDRVQAAIEGGGHGRLAVVVLNLNRFKPVNDALGYELGDHLLRQVADRLGQAITHDRDLVSRLGGDEFALMLPGSSIEQAQATTRRIATAFELPLRLKDQTVDLSAAFGVAGWPEQAASAEQLLSRAEIAMHEAKRRTELAMVYQTAMDPDSATTLSLLSELRRAVDQQELRLFLQPKFALRDGRLIGAEALVRWLHPVRGMVPPLAFIPFAEQTGFVRELTTWIFDDAARQWPALAAMGLQRLSVNLSARDVMDLGLPERLDGILVRRGVPAEAFCLEITESAIMDDPQRALNILQALKARGFKLSIDDFGEGYTSLKHLRHLPVDELKVDGIFVKKMDTVPQDENVVRSVIDLAHNLGLSVVAEGVENAEVWRRLAAMGCDEAQGFFMCRPLPADELPGFGQRWAAERPVAARVPASV
jgi:diguanylate cyclase (GGDEF)-like protein